jgi:hypothetical protein
LAGFVRVSRHRLATRESPAEREDFALSGKVSSVSRHRDYVRLAVDAVPGLRETYDAQPLTLWATLAGDTTATQNVPPFVLDTVPTHIKGATRFDTSFSSRSRP